MLYMGNIQGQIPKKANFEDVQHAIHTKTTLLNTLPLNNQECLIKTTIHATDEEHVINALLQYSKSSRIIIYGKNANEECTLHKYKQLNILGFDNVFVYLGGLFEWLLLQDIYGKDEFPTTKNELDMLKYKAPRMK
jgi:hypothetical protein